MSDAYIADERGRDDDDYQVRENPEVIACVRWSGALCWVMVGFIVFAIMVNNISVTGVSDAPAYAKTLLYTSMGYHFVDVQDYLYRSDPPPPPPNFFRD